MPQRHRVLIIGVGSIGERHLRCFLATQRVDAAFVEINPQLRETISTRYGNVTGFASLDAAIQATSDGGVPFDAAVICTPAPFHLPQANQLLRAGMHLLIEKPLSVGLQGVTEVQTLADDLKRVVGVAYVYRSHPVLQAMREKVQLGFWGKPVQLTAVCGQNFPTYRPAYREIYYRDRATGGGAIQDALTHIINAGEWILGPVERLVTDADHKVLEGVTVEDTVHVIARHGEVMASYSLNQHQAPNENTITIVCERGTVRFEGHENRWRWMDRPGETWHDEVGGPMERDTMFIMQANRFLDAIQGGAPFPCSLAEGAQTLRVNLACLASLEAGGWKRPREVL